MPSDIPDLWGADVATTEMVTPLAILRQQASLLGPKTQNLVEAEVVTTTSGGDFFHSFNLVVPALDGYRYELFRLAHGPALYPVYVHTGPDAGTSLQTEQALLNYLKAVLASQKTARLVGALKAQVQS